MSGVNVSLTPIQSLEMDLRQAMEEKRRIADQLAQDFGYDMIRRHPGSDRSQLLEQLKLADTTAKAYNECFSLVQGYPSGVLVPRSVPYT